MATESKENRRDDRPQIEQLDNITATMAAQPVSVADEQATLADFWQNKRVLGFCLLISLLPVNFGYEMGALGKLYAVIPFAQRFGFEVDGVYVISARDQQLLGGAGTIGVFVSAFLTGYMSDIIGRKKTIVVATIVCMAGIIVQYFSNSVMVLFGGKLVATLGFGLGHSLAPVFIAELAPVKLRGICLALINTMIMIGSWLNSVAILGCEHYQSDLAWRIPLATQFIPPGILLIGLSILPESPAWFIMNGKDEDAAKAYRRYNGPSFDIDSAMAVGKLAVQQEKEIKDAQGGSRWIDCFRGADRRRTILTVMVYTSQQLVGVTFVTGYLTYFFRLAGVKDALAVGQASFAIQIAGNMASWPLVDRVGRRPLIVWGAVAITLLLLLIGGISMIGTQPALLATVALMCMWGFLYQMTLGAIAYTVTGETPSVQLRQKTYSINMMVSTAVSTGIIQATPYLINTDQANLGGKICFIFFGLSVPMCIWLYFYMPELKGRNYAEIQEMFNKNVPSREFASYVCEVSAAGEASSNKLKTEEA